MIHPDDWVFAVDFGTTNTVAAVGDGQGVRPLTIKGKTVTPSAVMLQERGTWLVGDLAINAARRDLASFDPTPKSSIRYGCLALGGRNVPVVEAVAAMMRFVTDEAQRQHGSRPPKHFVVTHPAGWADGRINVLLAAARTAARRTWPDPTPLAEPVAAAQGVLTIADMPFAARVVVLDLGGGTVDVATVDRVGSQLTVVGSPGGIDDAAGEEFDLRLARLMTKEAGEDGLYDKLSASDDPADLRLALDIRNLARNVKERLSVEAFVPIPVPVTPNASENRLVQISRDQLKELIQGGDNRPPGLIEAVRLVTSALRQTPHGPPFEGVYLVGGSSRIPLLGMLLQQEIGRPPISQGDPGVAVAEGAAAWALRRTDEPPTQPTQVPAPGSERGAGDGGTPSRPGLVHRLLHAVRHRPRPVIGALIFGLLVGAAGLALVPGLLPLPRTPPCATKTLKDSSGVCSSIVNTPPAVHATTDGVPGCPTAVAPGCAQAILVASRAVWPEMPTNGCSTHESEYGADFYSAECDSGTLSYNVFWRKPAMSIVPTFAGQMTTPTLNDFLLPGSLDKLGTQIGGSRTTQSGPRFTCVWEYAAYPVTMLIDGPDDNSTVALCQTEKFLDSTAMGSAMPTQ